MAEKYGKTSAQILLRFLTQLGIAVIPKSAKEIRQKENMEVYTKLMMICIIFKTIMIEIL